MRSGGLALMAAVIFALLCCFPPVVLRAPSAPPPADPVRRLPDVVIIGVRKGGTRALLEMLKLHSAIVAAPHEVHFLDRDGLYRRGPLWYAAQMPPARPGQLVVEKTPAYFGSERAPERLLRTQPAARLLLIVREPVERLLSDYTQGLHRRLERSGRPRGLEELLLLSDGRLDPDYRPLNRSLYHEPLRRWLALWPRGRLHLVDGDALIRDPLPEMRRVERFLGLEPQISQDNFYFNSTRGFHCLRARGRQRCLHPSKGRPHPRPGPALLRQLHHFYSRPNQEFFRLAGRTFDWN